MKETKLREYVRQWRLDRALDKINRQCVTLRKTAWPHMADEIFGHLAYIADAEAQRRHRGIVPANT